MENDLSVKTVGIVACGLIGMSWAAYYLAKGFSVRATDLDADAEKKMRSYSAIRTTSDSRVDSSKDRHV